MFERSYHFIPANRPNLFDRSHSMGADAYIFDLEDAVARADKSAALAALDTWLGTQKDLGKYFVRVNGYHDSLAGAERSLLLKYPELGVVFPKVSSAAVLLDSVKHYSSEGSCRIIALIEDAAGVTALPEILNLNLLTAVALGLEDFLSHSIFETSRLTKFVDHVRAQIALAAMAAGIDAIDTISLDLSGGELLAADVRDACASGFNAKFSIHPNQIAAINAGFSPSESDLKLAASISFAVNPSDLESGYLKINEAVISPPKLKKLQTIKEFSNHRELTK